MRCSKAERYISDYIDGHLKAKDVEKLEMHLKQCTKCQDLLSDMRSMIAETKQLDSVAPANDLWPSIRRQVLDSGAEGETWAKAKRFFSGLSLYPREMAISASAFLAGIIFMSLFFYGMPYVRYNTSVPVQVASSPYNEVEYHYQQAIDALNTAISEQNVKLNPELAAVFKENLEIIDNSIRTFRAAIDRHPEDQDATEYLMICYRKKLELLAEMKDLMMQAG